VTFVSFFFFLFFVTALIWGFGIGFFFHALRLLDEIPQKKKKKDYPFITFFFNIVGACTGGGFCLFHFCTIFDCHISRFVILIFFRFAHLLQYHTRACLGEPKYIWAFKLTSLFLLFFLPGFVSKL